MAYNSKELKIKYAKGDGPSQKKNPNVADMSKLEFQLKLKKRNS